LISSRTSEGRRRAISRGVKMGRKSSLSAAAVARIARERSDPNGASVTDLAAEYGVSVWTIRRASADQ
jgi:DNA invertase Pin-like site-specific DNA recombinase